MSTILVDNLTGKTSAGSITVTSEGGAATFQLQQGAAKQWWSVDHLSPSNQLLDSFNVSSMTDIATGKLGPAFSNNMNNDDYTVALVSQANHFGCADTLAGFTTSDYDTSFRNLSGSPTDLDVNRASVHGDLA